MNYEQLHNASGRRPAITVLLVDDQPFVGVVIKRLLASETDIEVHCCPTATDALNTAVAMRPSLILQDLAMPGIDGLTLVGSYRAHAVTANTPVVVLSGNDDPASRQRCLAGGADDYLIKLPARADLIACVRRFATSVGRSTAPAETASLENPTMECRLDPRVIGDIVGASPEFANELVDLFIQDAWGRVDALSTAFAARERDTLRTLAHSLKGSSSTVGARRLSTICHRLEQHAAGSGDYETAGPMVAAIRSELAALVLVFADAKLGTIRNTRGAA